MENNKELNHSGVKGMKWGVRKDLYNTINNSGKAISDGAKNASEANSRITNNTRKNKRASRMTDAELKEAIARMELEQRYSNLNPSAVSKGASTATAILSAVGSVAAVAASVASVALAIGEFRNKQTIDSTT